MSILMSSPTTVASHSHVSGSSCFPCIVALIHHKIFNLGHVVKLIEVEETNVMPEIHHTSFRPIGMTLSCLGVGANPRRSVCCN